MQINPNNKFTYFLTPEGAQHYTNAHQKITLRFANDFHSYLRKAGFHEGTLLDVGSGDCVLAMCLHDWFPQANIIGVDYSPHMIAIGKEKLATSEKSDSITLLEGDMQALPIDDHTIDAVVSLNTLHFASNLTQAFNELYRVLKPDGCLIIINIIKPWFAFLNTALQVSYPKKEFIQALEQSQWHDYQVKTRPFWIDILWHVPK
jgi:ubiquinone/menaquinone biosynthesis C-methylase UbiE